jgi:hypothetical protein
MSVSEQPEKRGAILNMRALVVVHDLIMVALAWTLARLAAVWLLDGNGIQWQQLALEVNLILILQGFLHWRAATSSSSPCRRPPTSRCSASSRSARRAASSSARCRH